MYLVRNSVRIAIVQASVGKRRKSQIRKKTPNWWKKKLEILALLQQWLPEIAAGL
jgi:hypothetical protein